MSCVQLMYQLGCTCEHSSLLNTLPSQQDMLTLQAAMWKHTVWPKLPPNKWEKDQPSKHDDALITLLWDQLVG